jgi:hypothetical protein
MLSGGIAYSERVVRSLGVVLPDKLCEFGPTAEPTFLKDRRDVRVGDEALKALLIPVEDHPPPMVVSRIEEDVRTLAPVLLSLLGTLRGERIPEAVEILELRCGQDHVYLLPLEGSARPLSRGGLRGEGRA